MFLNETSAFGKIFIILTCSRKATTIWKPDGWRATVSVSSEKLWHRSRLKWLDWL